MTANNPLSPESQQQTTYENDATARRVILVNSSGTIIRSTIQEENRAGSEATGIDGATGRVLTLVNTDTSGDPTSVWVDDQIIAIADYTMNHLSASSTITFDNINLFDAQTVRVRYYI